jgi:GT2 family glycosyltransferase
MTIANEVNDVTPTLFSSGGACLVRREDFISLGGFDELYYPAYWEDIDLCYRGWKRGKASLYQPESVVYHVHSASMEAKPEHAACKKRITHRNCWLFTWRNIRDPRILRNNLFWTFRHYFYSIRVGDKETLTTYHQAFSRWGQALAGRKSAETGRLCSDRDILLVV